MDLVKKLLIGALFFAVNKSVIPADMMAVPKGLEASKYNKQILSSLKTGLSKAGMSKLRFNLDSSLNLARLEEKLLNYAFQFDNSYTYQDLINDDIEKKQGVLRWFRKIEKDVVASSETKSNYEEPSGDSFSEKENDSEVSSESDKPLTVFNPAIADELLKGSGAPLLTVADTFVRSSYHNFDDDEDDDLSEEARSLDKKNLVAVERFILKHIPLDSTGGSSYKFLLNLSFQKKLDRIAAVI